jgi:hypothetical protein
MLKRCGKGALPGSRLRLEKNELSHDVVVDVTTRLKMVLPCCSVVLTDDGASVREGP